MKCHECNSDEIAYFNSMRCCEECGAILDNYVVEFESQSMYKDNYTTNNELSYNIADLARGSSLSPQLINELDEKFIKIHNIVKTGNITQKKKKYVMLYILFGFCVHHELWDLIPALILKWPLIDFCRTKKNIRDMMVLGYFSSSTFSFINLYLIEYHYYLGYYTHLLNLNYNNLATHKIPDKIWQFHYPKSVGLSIINKHTSTDVSKYINNSTSKKILKLM